MKFLGMSFQHHQDQEDIPYCFIASFVVEDEAYAVCATLWDDTMTEDKKMFDMYQLDLHRITGLQYFKERKFFIEEVTLGERLRQVIFKFSKEFPKHSIKRNQNNNLLTPDCAANYTVKENAIILNRLLKPFFDSKHHTGLQDMIKEHMEFEIDTTKICLLG